MPDARYNIRLGSTVLRHLLSAIWEHTVLASTVQVVTGPSASASWAHQDRGPQSLQSVSQVTGGVKLEDGELRRKSYDWSQMSAPPLVDQLLLLTTEVEYMNTHDSLSVIEDPAMSAASEKDNPELSSGLKKMHDTQARALKGILKSPWVLANLRYISRKKYNLVSNFYISSPSSH